jgi:DNA polymerase-3 subunit alpha
MFCGHAHVHDEYSPLDGAANRNQLSYEAVLKGQWFLGFTNHGRLGGALEHIDACRHPEKYDNPVEPGKKRGKDERLIPALGMEAYWRPDRFMECNHTWAQHLCLHAKNLNGWRTLMRLSSKSWVKRERGGGFYGKPVIDWDMFEADHEDIIVSTACINSPVSHLILDGDESGARKWCVDMISLVGEDNFFFEIMPHNLDSQREVNIGKVNIANELGQPFMVTGDVHMPYEYWKDTHLVVMMAATRQSFAKREKKAEAGEEVYGEEIDTLFLSSERELQEMFADYHPELSEDVVQEALDNTEVFAKRFKPILFGTSPKMPKAGTPEKIENTINGWLDEGRDRREQNWRDDGVTDAEFKHRRKLYEERIDYEWDVIQGKRQLDYFYLVGDVVRWARSNEPLPPPGEGYDDLYPEHRESGFRKRPIRVTCRGSAAGCLISYDIRITNVDPIPHGFLFERFLNPDRLGMPDIDIDVESGRDGRDLVKEYIRREHGEDHVADIIAYQTFAPRAVIKAVNDVFDISYIETKKVTDSIGETERGIMKLANDNPVLAKHMQDHPEVVPHWLRLEDQILRDTRHAAGMLITPGPTSNYVPTQLGADDVSTVTAWADRAEFPALSDNGFIKLDVLGVNALRKQQVAVELIREYYDVDFEPDDLPAQRDPYNVEQEVLDMFVHGLTAGVFQFGGRGITQLLRHIKPTSIVDLTIANALYRPGPVKFAFEYGDKKNGKTPVTYIHEAVEPVLKETLGVICFQEQIMELCKQVGNFTGGQADSMRKAVAKLYRIPGDAAQQYMQTFYETWIEGCYANGIREEDGDEMWRWVLPFGNYAFNRSHAGTYALQAHQDMFIKRHWPRAFYASLLTVEHKPKRNEQQDFMRSVLREARIFDIDATGPDINRSRAGWVIDEDKLRYGMVSIVGIGSGTAKQVEQHAPYDSFEDFSNRMDSGFGNDNIATLARAGAFDELEDRHHLLAKVRRWGWNVAKYDVVMSCGCKKIKTVKAAKQKGLEKATRLAMIEVECKKHPDATVAEYIEVDPFYTMAQWLRENPGKEPPDGSMPATDDDLLQAEAAVLHIPMATASTTLQYREFVAERVFTEEEIEAAPPKPERKKGQHGGFCSCKECTAAEVVVGGEVVSVKVIKTKRTQELMAFVDFAFDVSSYSVTLFPWAYRRFQELLQRPTLFLVAGHKDKRGTIVGYEVSDVIDVAEELGWTPDEVPT